MDRVATRLVYCGRLAAPCVFMQPRGPSTHLGPVASVQQVRNWGAFSSTPAPKSVAPRPVVPAGRANSSATSLAPSCWLRICLSLALALVPFMLLDLLRPRSTALLRVLNFVSHLLAPLSQRLDRFYIFFKRCRNSPHPGSSYFSVPSKSWNLFR